MPRRAALASLLCLTLTGCGGFAVGSGSSGSSDAEALANVRAVIPALEAYYADNGTYRGATADLLRTTYDQGIPDVEIVRANDRTYCVESTAAGFTANKRGPAAELTAGGC